MKRRLPLLMLIHQRKWKKTFPPITHWVTQRVSALHSLIAQVVPIEGLMSASDYREMPSDWKGKSSFWTIPALRLWRPHNPATMLLKHTYITHISWSYFFPHFGHANIAIKNSLGVSDLGTTCVKGICQIRSFFKQLWLPCTRSLLLSSLERGRDRCCL